MVAGWNPLLFPKHRFHILHFPNSTGLFTKPTGRHYTKYRFSSDIAVNLAALHIFFFVVVDKPYCQISSPVSGTSNSTAILAVGSDRERSHQVVQWWPTQSLDSEFRCESHERSKERPTFSMVLNIKPRIWCIHLSTWSNFNVHVMSFLVFVFFTISSPVNSIVNTIGRTFVIM